jgi:hypothetical protein
MLNLRPTATGVYLLTGPAPGDLLDLGGLAGPRRPRATGGREFRRCCASFMIFQEEGRFQ